MRWQEVRDLEHELSIAKARGDRYFDQAFDDRQRLIDCQQRINGQRCSLDYLNYLYSSKINDLGVVQFADSCRKQERESRDCYWNLFQSNEEILEQFWKLYDLFQKVECFRFVNKNGNKAYLVSNHPTIHPDQYVVLIETGTETEAISGKMDLDEAIDFAKSLAEQN